VDDTISLDADAARSIADRWVEAWNAHDPERVVAHFTDDVVVTSPLADRLRPGSGGVLRGKDEVLSYYREGLAGVPDLHFTLVDVGVGVGELAIVYRNQRDALVVEWLRLASDGRACEVRVAYAQ
jgi:uncharacterized protein (TIGR02246 family)